MKNKSFFHDQADAIERRAIQLEAAAKEEDRLKIASVTKVLRSAAKDLRVTVDATEKRDATEQAVREKKHAREKALAAKKEKKNVPKSA
jgi:hypothetical protein